MLQILQAMISSGIIQLKHLAGQQGNYTPCLKLLDDVKMKVIEMLKADDAKKEAKVTLQAVANNVCIGEDEYQYEYPIEGSSQRPYSDPSRPQDRWINLFFELRKS